MARASAVIIKKGRVLLIHRKKEGKEYWVFPGGTIEENETSEEAVVREVKEETNLDVTCAEYRFDYLDEVRTAHPVFFCKVNNKKLKLGGPEALKHSEKDWYHPEWIGLNKAVKLEIYPEEGRRVLQNLYHKVHK